MVVGGAKWTEIWKSVTLIQHTTDTFVLVHVVLKVIWGSLNEL